MYFQCSLRMSCSLLSRLLSYTVYNISALCTGVCSYIVHCNCTMHLVVQWHFTLSLLSTLHFSLTVCSARSSCTGEWTVRANYKCSVLYAHPASKCCALWPDYTHWVLQIARLAHLVRMNCALLVHYVRQLCITVCKLCCKLQFLCK